MTRFHQKSFPVHESFSFWCSGFYGEISVSMYSLLGLVEDGSLAGDGVDLADGRVVAGGVGVVLGDDDGAVGHDLVRAVHAVPVAG